MTIEIHEPELEEMIRKRMQTGEYRDVEDVLLQALRTWTAANIQALRRESRQNLADFLLQSPLHGSGLIVERVKDYPRDINL